MRNKLWTTSLFAIALFISGTAQAALVTLTFSNGSNVTSVFTMDSEDMLTVQNDPFSSGRVPLTSAVYFNAGSALTFEPNYAFYGPDINFETTEFRVSDNAGSTLQLGSVLGTDPEFTYDAATNEVTYSGQFDDPLNGWTPFSFSGSDYSVDLTALQANGFEGFVNTNTLNTFYSVDALQVSVSAVPVPAAIWLFGTGLVGLFGISRRHSRKYPIHN